MVRRLVSFPSEPAEIPKYVNEHVLLFCFDEVYQDDVGHTRNEEGERA